MKNQTCCFTGHRTIPEREQDSLSDRLQEIIRCLVRSGYRYFGTGGALGFDTMAAQAVLHLKAEFPHIKLILVLPCKNQADKWSEKDRITYENIKRRADKVVYISDYYTRECMLQRNRHLVDCSSFCICYLTRNSGGTAYTVNYAKGKAVPIVNLAQNTT